MHEEGRGSEEGRGKEEGGRWGGEVRREGGRWASALLSGRYDSSITLGC